MTAISPALCIARTFTGNAFPGILAVVLSIAAAATWSYITRVSMIDPLPSNWPPTPRREGVFARNQYLQQLRKVGVGELPGPEDVAVDDKGRLYTGCADGWIKRIEPETWKVENWVHVGGHPLGVMWGLNGELLVCEPARGLLNVTERRVEVLSSGAGGVRYKLADGLDVARDGTIYFTDASSKFGMNESDYDVLQCRPNGRLLKYEPITRRTSVLLKDLFFPNGVALSSKQDFLVFCETAMLRCRKYYLQGKKKGKTEVFIENLPGYPDNIKHNRHDKFWIGLISDRNWLMDLVMKVAPLKHILTLPGVLSKITSSTKMAKVLAVSESGKPLAFFEDPTGESIAFVTTALQVGENLYLGNLARNYLGVLQLPKSQV